MADNITEKSEPSRHVQFNANFQELVATSYTKYLTILGRTTFAVTLIMQYKNYKGFLYCSYKLDVSHFFLQTLIAGSHHTGLKRYKITILRVFAQICIPDYNALYAYWWLSVGLIGLGGRYIWPICKAVSLRANDA